MANFEIILQKIQNWDLAGAKQDLSNVLDLDDTQTQQLDKLFREYSYVATTIEALRVDSVNSPETVLSALDKLPEIKAKYPGYDQLLDNLQGRIKANQREAILSRIREAENKAQKAKSWQEAQEILQGVINEYPGWANDTEIERKIHQVRGAAEKAEKANILKTGILEDIKSGKPTEGMDRLNRLELLGKLDTEEIKEYRKELERLAAHKQARSSKDTSDFSSSDDLTGDIATVERSVSSIQSQSNYSYRLLLNNQALKEQLYKEAGIKLRTRLVENKKNKDELIKQLQSATQEQQRQTIQQELSDLEQEAEALETKRADLALSQDKLNADLSELEQNARKQIALKVEALLGDGETALKNGNLQMAQSFLEMARQAGLKEEYDDPRLTDKLGNVALTPELDKRAGELSALIQNKQQQRQLAQEKKEAAQKQLSGQLLTLKQLKRILSELEDAKALDSGTPGLASAIQSMQARIEQETQLQREQYKLRITLLCKQGLIEEAQRQHELALGVLGDDIEIRNLWSIIQETQIKVQHLGKVAEDFQVGFRLVREALATPDNALQALLTEWKKDGFDTARIAHAEAHFLQYINGLPEIRQQVTRLETGLRSTDPLTGLQDAAEYLRNCFLRNEARIQDLLARYWLAMANQFKDKDQFREEEYLQASLDYADGSKNTILLTKIKERLTELQSHTELGRKVRDLEEILGRYKEMDLPRALEKIAEIASDDPVRRNIRVARLIDDIEYENKRKRAVDYYQKAKDQFIAGDYDVAEWGTQQALFVLPNYFEALQLDGDIKAARADESPFIHQIDAALAIGQGPEKKLNVLQVKQLEETKFLVDQLERKPRISFLLSTKKKQFTSYYDGWRNQIEGKVQTDVKAAMDLITIGDFDAAAKILTSLREIGIPFDKLADISNAENELQINQAQSVILDGKIQRASDLAGDGKNGIVQAIALLTMKDAPEFIKSKIESNLNFFKSAQVQFGQISEDVEQNKGKEISSLLDVMRKMPTKIEFGQWLDVAKSYDSELQKHIITLKNLHIKESNQTFQAVKHLQKIVIWYIASIETSERDAEDHNYTEIARQITQQIGDGQIIRKDLPSDLPNLQAIHSSIDVHTALLKKLKQNNDLFTEVYKKIASSGSVGWPNKGFWQTLRTRLDDVRESPHIEPDERKIKQLLERINQKEMRISSVFKGVITAVGLISLCLLTGLTITVGPMVINHAFPSPTVTSTPTITPTTTLTPTITPIPSITPRSTVTPIPPTPTPMPLRVKVLSNDLGVYLYPAVMGRIYTLPSNTEIYVLRYCILERDYWGEVHFREGQTPDDYGWILMFQYTSVDFVNADIEAGLRKKSVSEIFNNHPELQVSCPIK